LFEVLEGETDADTLTDKVYDGILVRIIRGEFPGGMELKSTRLAALLNTSRTPVIHALARLLTDGIISQQTHRRAIVRPGAENWLIDVHELRCELEPGAAQAAAGRVAEDVEHDMFRLARDIRSMSGDAWREALRHFDYALHLVVAESCGNLAIRETIRKCWLYKRLAYEYVEEPADFLQQGYDEHLEILNHLHRGNGSRAASAMRNHLKAAGQHRGHTRIV
jgi:DNA-binding GntR family transcriptional regulator